MVRRSLAAALAASCLASAQTSTKCNPLQTTCPADPAFGPNKVFCDFTKGACSAFQSSADAPITYDERGAVFSITGEGQGPTITSNAYIFFGRVDIVMQAAPGKGIVTSAVLQSDDLDEIDWEWIGNDNVRAQTNYFSKGDTTTWDRGGFAAVSDATGTLHTYSIEWTSKAVVWLIDDAVVRTLTYDSAKAGAAFPQTPMQIKLGTWVGGGKDSPPGTVEWAGGHVDWSQAPFNAYYKSISIVDYAGKDAPSGRAAREYVYADHSGDYRSIQVRE